MNRIEEIKARCDKATKGPWKQITKGNTVQSHAIFADVDEGTNGVFRRTICSGISPKTQDADFIAHSRSDLPWALDQIAALTAELDRLTEAQRWIPVTEGIPPYGDEVLVMHENVVDIAVMDEVNVFTSLFTHWMPLPAAIEKGAEK